MDRQIHIPLVDPTSQKKKELFFEGRNFGENVSEIEWTYLVLGGTADVLVALGMGDSVELGPGPRRRSETRRLSEFRCRVVQKVEKK